jgi:hypothetical protein
MNKNALTWLKERQQEAAIRAKRAFLLGAANTEKNATRAISQLILRKYGVNREAETITHAHSPQYWIDQLENDLYEDLHLLTNNDPLLAQCAIGYIPDIKGNAIAKKVCASSYAIAINLGVVWLCFLFAQSILMEAEDERADEMPKNVFLSALRAFSAMSSDEFDKEVEYCKQAGGIDLLISSAGIGSVILRFIGLHEFAHIKLGHADSFYRSLSISADGVNTEYQAPSSIDLSIRQLEELHADRFAVKKILEQSTSKETAWNSVLFICAFFQALQYIEDTQNKSICPEHPSPSARSIEIINYCHIAIGPVENDAFIWLNAVFNTWKGNYMNEIDFSVRTDNPNEILDLFKNDTTLCADGLRIILKDTTAERGMTVEEVVINFSLSLVSGIPAGMVANYLYQRFSRNGENVLRIVEKLVKDVDEIKGVLEKLTK